MKTAKSKDYAMGIRRVRVGDAIRKENKNGSRKKIWDTRKDGIRTQRGGAKHNHHGKETLTRKQRGEIGELAFFYKALSLGMGVAKPYGDSSRYDFIANSGGRLWRVQVKSAHCGDRYGGYCVHAHGNAHMRPYTAKEIDVLVAFIMPENLWYVVPIAAFVRIKSMKFFRRVRGGARNSRSIGKRGGI